MTIRFSAALPSVRNHVPRGLGRVPLRSADNDNSRDVRNDPLLRAALRHFATHGLGAAANARDRAVDSFIDGDGDAFRWWLGICAKLDRRMAVTVQSRTAQR
jgi:hypothetical protein